MNGTTMTGRYATDTSAQLADLHEELLAIEAALAEADDGAQQTRLRLAAESRRMQIADLRRRMQ